MEERLQQLAKSREPSPDDGAARHAAIERLRGLLPALFPPPSRLALVTYGSFRSTCYSPDSDLDLALTGRLALPDWAEARGPDGTAPLEALREDDWVALLRALADALEGAGLSRGPVTRILEARVPIIKFVESASGIECDICVTTRGCDFKGAVMQLLHSLQPSLAPLIRLVKQWARQHDINNAHAGTLNSWSLALMALWAQQAFPAGALAPPLWRLFHEQEPEGPGGAGRPLQDKNMPLEVSLAAAAAKCATAGGQLLHPRWSSCPPPGLLEQLLWFLSAFAAITGTWRDSAANRNWRVSPWLGRGYTSRFPRAYLAAVEEPFDCNDNTARSVGIRERNESTLPYIAWVFGHSVHTLRSVAGVGDAARALAWLFGPAALPAIGLSQLQLAGSALPPHLLRILQRSGQAAAEAEAGAGPAARSSSGGGGGEAADAATGEGHEGRSSGKAAAPKQAGPQGDAEEAHRTVVAFRALIDATRVGSPIMTLEEWRHHSANGRGRPPLAWHPAPPPPRPAPPPPPPPPPPPQPLVPPPQPLLPPPPHPHPPQTPLPRPPPSQTAPPAFAGLAAAVSDLWWAPLCDPALSPDQQATVRGVARTLVAAMLCGAQAHIASQPPQHAAALEAALARVLLEGVAQAEACPALPGYEAAAVAGRLRGVGQQLALELTLATMQAAQGPQGQGQQLGPALAQLLIQVMLQAQQQLQQRDQLQQQQQQAPPVANGYGALSALFAGAGSGGGGNGTASDARPLVAVLQEGVRGGDSGGGGGHAAGADGGGGAAGRALLAALQAGAAKERATAAADRAGAATAAAESAMARLALAGGGGGGQADGTAPRAAPPPPPGFGAGPQPGLQPQQQQSARWSLGLGFDAAGVPQRQPPQPLVPPQHAHGQGQGQPQQPAQRSGSDQSEVDELLGLLTAARESTGQQAEPEPSGPPGLAAGFSGFGSGSLAAWGKPPTQHSTGAGAGGAPFNLFGSGPAAQQPPQLQQLSLSERTDSGSANAYGPQHGLGSQPQQHNWPSSLFGPAPGHLQQQQQVGWGPWGQAGGGSGAFGPIASAAAPAGSGAAGSGSMDAPPGLFAAPQNAQERPGPQPYRPF